MDADIVIYGATPAGIAAALQAARMGKRPVLVAAEDHLGGMITNGLSATAFGRRAAIGGIAREFHQRLGRRYHAHECWTYEPHVAESVLGEMLGETGIECRLGRRLAAAPTDGNRIVAVRLDDGDSIRAPLFVDATYEGDLMAAAGVSYKVGRESNATYGERLNGVHRGDPNHKFAGTVDPYVVPGNSDSGLLAGIEDAALGPEGSGDHRVQAYCFRMILTQTPENRLSVPRPTGYDPAQHLLLLRCIESGAWNALDLMVPIPGGKVDVNNWSAVSLDYIGGNYGWPDGDARGGAAYPSWSDRRRP